MCAEILADLPLDGSACFFVFYSLEFFYPGGRHRILYRIVQNHFFQRTGE